VGYGEVGRALRTYLAVVNVARFAVRYAVVDAYDESYCGTPPVLERAAQSLKDDYGLTTFAASSSSGGTVVSLTPETLNALDGTDGYLDCGIAAPDIDPTTLATLNAALADSARYYSVLRVVDENTSSIIDRRYLKVTLCSSRPSYAYDAAHDVCRPHDDVGRMGDRVLVNVTYQYLLGASFGLTPERIPMRSTREGIVESFGPLGPVALPVPMTGTPTPLPMPVP